MTTQIHPSAVVEEGARIGAGARIGPFCHVGGQVSLGAGCTLTSHVTVSGQTVLGEGCRVFPFAALGFGAQHLSHQDDPCGLEIGAGTVIRESVTMHTGTSIGRGKTVVGRNGYFMAGSHVAHDAIVGDNVIFTNNAVIGGHAEIGDFAILGGNAAVHQFARVGAFAFVGGMAGLEEDLIPYGICIGNRANLNGLNLIGMKRRGLTREAIHTVRRAYRDLFSGSGVFQDRLTAAKKTYAGSAEVKRIFDFIEAPSKRALCMPLTATTA